MSDTKPQPSNTKKGLTISWSIMLAIGFILFLGVATFMPSTKSARPRARITNSANNLKQIGLALRLYADDHAGKFPPKAGIGGIAFLVPNNRYIEFGSLFANPNNVDTSAGGDTLDEENTHYAYLGSKMNNNMSPSEEIPLAIEKPYKDMKGKLNVLYLDGHVKLFEVGEVETIADAIRKMGFSDNHPAVQDAIQIDKGLTKVE